MMVCPCSWRCSFIDALIAPLKKLYDQGIEIITVDTFLGDGDYSKSSNYSFPLAYIGTDNELGGKRVAEHLAKMLGEKGKVYVNTTNPDVSSVMGRVKGFKEGIAEFPNMEVVGVDYNLDVQGRAFVFLPREITNPPSRWRPGKKTMLPLSISGSRGVKTALI